MSRFFDSGALVAAQSAENRLSFSLDNGTRGAIICGQDERSLNGIFGIADNPEHIIQVGIIFGNQSEKQTFINLCGLDTVREQIKKAYPRELQPALAVYDRSTGIYISFFDYLNRLEKGQQITFSRKIFEQCWLIQPDEFAPRNLTAVYAIFAEITRHADYLNEKKFVELLFDPKVRIQFQESGLQFDGYHCVVINGERRGFTGDTIITISREEKGQQEELYIAPKDFEFYLQKQCKIGDDDRRCVNHVSYDGYKGSRTVRSSPLPGLFYMDASSNDNFNDTNPIVVRGVALKAKDILAAIAARKRGEISNLPVKVEQLPVAPAFNLPHSTETATSTSNESRTASETSSASPSVARPKSGAGTAEQLPVSNHETVGEEILLQRKFLGKNILPGSFDRHFSIKIEKQRDELEYEYTLEFGVSVSGSAHDVQERCNYNGSYIHEKIWKILKEKLTLSHENGVRLSSRTSCFYYTVTVNFPAISYEKYVKYSGVIIQEIARSKTSGYVSQEMPELADIVSGKLVLPNAQFSQQLFQLLLLRNEAIESSPLSRIMLNAHAAESSVQRLRTSSSSSSSSSKCSSCSIM